MADYIIFGEFREQTDFGLALLACLICVWSFVMSASMLERAISLDGVRKNIWIGVGAIVAANGLWASYYLSALAVHAQIPASIIATDTLLAALFVHLTCLLAFTLIVNRRSRSADLFGALVLGAGLVAMEYLGLKSLKIDPAPLLDPTGLGPSAALATAMFITAVFAFRPDQKPYKRIANIAALGVLVTVINILILAVSLLVGAPEERIALSDLSKQSLESVVFIVTCVLLVGIGAAYATDRLLNEREVYVSKLDRLVLKLKESEKAAQQASKAKSDFVTNISHEIRTPLSAIHGMLDLLESPSASFDQRRQLSIARSATESLLTLVNDLIDMSKLESGKLDVVFDSCNIVDAAQNVIDLLNPTIGEKRLDLRLIVEDKFPATIITDGSRVRQILINLIGNAIKFTDHGKIAVRLKSKMQKEDGALLAIEVEDTGIGIAPEIAGTLFERFVQGNASNDRHLGGAGLGLSISNEIAHLLGGKIAVRSRLGIGSCFTFEFEAKIGEAKERRSIEGNKGFGEKECRALIVEDNSTIRYLVEQMLNRFGMNWISTDNGRSAIDLVREQKFDVILMDIQMPEMDGLTAARRIRLLGPHGAKTPIIALSASTFSFDKERCFAAGMDAFVEKPIDAKKLLGAILSALNTTADRTQSTDEISPISGATASSRDANENQDAVLNYITLASLRELFGAEGARKMVDSTLLQAAALLDQAQSALANGELSEAKRLAHGIRGLAGNWGADRLAAEAKRLELEASDLREAHAMLKIMRDLIARSRRAFDEELQTAVESGLVVGAA